MSGKYNLKKFREYTAAVIDKETSKAAELYANYSEDETFVNMVTAFHGLSDAVSRSQRRSAIEFLKEELYMTDYDIEKLEEQLAGPKSNITDYADALRELQENIGKKGCKMSVWDIEQILKSDEFRNLYWRE